VHRIVSYAWPDFSHGPERGSIIIPLPNTSIFYGDVQKRRLKPLALKRSVMHSKVMFARVICASEKTMPEFLKSS
jgi:hypothetical protein